MAAISLPSFVVDKVTPEIKNTFKSVAKTMGSAAKNFLLTKSNSTTVGTQPNPVQTVPPTPTSSALQPRTGNALALRPNIPRSFDLTFQPEEHASMFSKTWSRVKKSQQRGNIKIKDNWKSFKSSKEKWATPDRKKSASLISGMSVDLMKDSISNAVQLDQTMQNLKRTVGFSEPEQFAQMRQSILDLSNQVPVTTNAIAGMVKAASQSGIAKDQLMNFATTASKVSVAFGMSEDQTTSALLKWRKDLGITGQQTNAFADTIAHMSQTMNVSSASIMELIDTKGALAKKAGLTNQEIAGLATAMLASGTSTETAATGLEKLVTTLSNAGELNPEQAEQFQKLGIDPSEIAAEMDTNAGATIDGLLKKLSQIEKSKRSAALTDLFGADAAQAILPLVDNTDRLTNSFRAAHSQAEAQNALQRDFAEGAASASQSSVLLENRISNLKATLGTALLPALIQITETLGTVIVGIANFSSEYPTLTQYVIGGIAALWGLSKVFTIVRSGIALLSFVVPPLIGGFKLLAALMFANPIGLIIGGAIAAVTALIVYWDEVVDLVSSAWNSVKGFFGWDDEEKNTKKAKKSATTPKERRALASPKPSTPSLTKSFATPNHAPATTTAVNWNQDQSLQLAAVPAQQAATASSVQNNTFNNTFQIGDHRSGDVERLAREVAKVLRSQRNGSLRG